MLEQHLDFAAPMNNVSAVKIAGIEITQHRFNFDTPFIASWDSQPRTYLDATIVKVIADNGMVGIGSGDLMVGFRGHEHLFIGQDVLDVERHYRVLSHINFHYGRCWPLDLALWDLAGKVAGQPCYKLLGGLSNRVRAYASSGTLRNPDEMADIAQFYLSENFPAMKIRFHRGDWRDDIKALESVRKRVGNSLELMVDCNQGWRMPWDIKKPWTYKDALIVARELEKLDVYWMEEPLHRSDRPGMRSLRDATSVRIAGGEMTRELYEFRDLIADGCLDVLQPDAALVGGITGLRRVALMAQEHNLTFTPHTWTNGMGVMANAHLTAGVADAPWLEFPYDPPAWNFDRRDYMMADPLKVSEDGYIYLSEKAGMGYELNVDLLAETKIS